MNARERILQRVRAARKEPAVVSDWPHPPISRDLVGCFTQALTAAKGEVFLAADLEEAGKLLGGLLTSLNAHRVVYNLEPPIEGLLVSSAFPQIVWKPSGGDAAEFQQDCVAADVGLTSAVFALAETGSIALSSSRGSRMVSLLPEVHIVLLDQRLLVPDLISWEQIRPEELPAQLVLVSGPSKTADIEQTLVVGAHGPKRFMVILYGS